MPKASTSDKRQSLRHNPLGEDASPKQKKSKVKPRSGADEEKFVDSRASRKILELGQELADEDQNGSNSRAAGANPAFDFSTRFPGEESEEVEPTQYDDDDAWGDEEEELVLDDDVDPRDLEMFNKFNPPQHDDAILQGGAFGGAVQQTAHGSQEQGTDLADLILKKIAAFEAGQQPDAPPEPIPEDAIEVPAKVVEAFSLVGGLLSRYKSGKLPKLFKALPGLPDWQIYLSMTRPDDWTPNAVHQATRLFISQKPEIAQEFLHEVLLPHVRQNISENPKINVHLFDALKRALYKPSAFFKGIVFPLVEGMATQKEARIVAAAVLRVTIKTEHSAAALYRLCDIAAEQMSRDMESAGATNILIKALIEKRYALPWKVVDALVFHFLRFKAVDPMDAEGPDAMTGVKGPGSKNALANGKLPVVWHQGLLAFAQRYRNEITEDQREALLDLLLVRGHKDIAPEIRRELLAGRGRGNVVEPTVADGGDDTMVMDA